MLSSSSYRACHLAPQHLKLDSMSDSWHFIQVCKLILNSLAELRLVWLRKSLSKSWGQSFQAGGKQRQKLWDDRILWIWELKESQDGRCFGSQRKQMTLVELKLHLAFDKPQTPIDNISSGSKLLSLEAIFIWFVTNQLEIKLSCGMPLKQPAAALVFQSPSPHLCPWVRWIPYGQAQEKGKGIEKVGNVALRSALQTSCLISTHCYSKAR